jgi:tetratricopeptide (TPR) repeat protein
MSRQRTIVTPVLPDEPDLDDERIEQALAMFGAGSYVRARDLLYSVLRDRPESVTSLLALGTSYVMTREWERVLRYADEVLRLRPEQSTAHQMRARALLEAGQLPAAREAAEWAVAYRPIAASYAILARICVRMDTEESNVAALRAAHDGMATTTDPTMLDALAASRARALVGLGAVNAAQPELTRLVTRNPNDPAIWLALLKATAQTLRLGSTIRATYRIADLVEKQSPALSGRLRRQAHTGVGAALLLLGGVGGAAILFVVTAQHIARGGAADDVAAGGGKIIAAIVTAGYLALLLWAAGRARQSYSQVPAALNQPVAAVGATLLALVVFLLVMLAARPQFAGHPPGAILVVVAIALVPGMIGVVIRLGVGAYRRRRRTRRYAAEIRDALVPPVPRVGPPRWDIETPAVGTLTLVSLPSAAKEATTWATGLASTGVTTVVSASREPDDNELGITIAAETAGLRLISFPIQYGSPPSEPEVQVLLDEAADLLRAGGTVAITSRTATGETAALAAGVLVRLGETPAGAWTRIIEARGDILTATPGQRAWVDRLC